LKKKLLTLVGGAGGGSMRYTDLVQVVDPVEAAMVPARQVLQLVVSVEA
jgi:hypothetical protein